MKNRECKRCGLLESTVLATETKCIPDRRMGTVLEGVHDFISECGCPTKYCKHYESDFDKYIKTKMTFNSKRIGIKHMKPKRKAVKGWAMLDGNGKRVERILLGRKCPTVFYVDSWGPYETCRENIVPCLITFPISKGNKKK